MTLASKPDVVGPITTNLGGFHRSFTELVSPSEMTDNQRKYKLRVMQFNALAHSLKSGETDAEFETRKDLNLDYILALKPSLLVMQECDTPETYGAGLAKSGYSVVAHHKNNSTKDFTCIFYRPEEGLQLVESEAQFFFVAPPIFKESSGCAGEEPREEEPVVSESTSSSSAQGLSETKMKSSQFALHCRFLHHGEPLYVIGQHAKAGRTEEMEEIRISHSKQLFQKVKRRCCSKETTAGDQEENPTTTTTTVKKDRVLWVGDMNAGPHSYGGQYPDTWYPWVMGEETWKEGGGHQHQPHGLRWSSAMREGRGSNPHATPSSDTPLNVDVDRTTAAAESTKGDEARYTTVKMRHGALIKQTIDYIFFIENDFLVTGYSEPPPIDEMSPDYLPNTVWGSDHLSVCVELCPANV